METVEKKPDVIQVESISPDGSGLEVVLISSEREKLADRGRQFVIDYLAKQPQYATWATAGIEKSSGPQAFDPSNPGRNPYSKENKDVKWWYRQSFRLTKML